MIVAHPTRLGLFLVVAAVFVAPVLTQAEVESETCNETCATKSCKKSSDCPGSEYGNSPRCEWEQSCELVKCCVAANSTFPASGSGPNLQASTGGSGTQSKNPPKRPTGNRKPQRPNTAAFIAQFSGTVNGAQPIVSLPAAPAAPSTCLSCANMACTKTADCNALQSENTKDSEDDNDNNDDETHVCKPLTDPDTKCPLLYCCEPRKNTLSKYAALRKALKKP